MICSHNELLNPSLLDDNNNSKLPPTFNNDSKLEFEQKILNNLLSYTAMAYGTISFTISKDLTSLESYFSLEQQDPYLQEVL